MRRASVKTVVALVSLSLGCSVSTERSALESGLDHPGLRAKTFEATARALDRHPEWVDEFYAVARRHPPLMHRFVAHDTHDLREKDLARGTGELLAENPPSLEEIFIATLDASHGKPEARAAIARAIAARNETLAGIVTDFPPALRLSMNGTVDDAAKKPAARAALLQSMRERSSEIAALVMGDHDTLKSLIQSMMKAGGGDAASFVKIIRTLLH